MSIPTGLAADTLLEIRDAGLVVRGHAPASAIVLRPNVPFVLNGFAIPTIHASLSYSEGAAGSMTIVHAQPAELDLLGETLKGTRPCADLGLEGDGFDPEKAVPGLNEKNPGEKKLLEGGQKVELRIQPKGKPVARLFINEATFVLVSETAGGMSRISLYVDTLIVFGWVKSSHLKKPGSITGYGSIGTRARLRDPERPILERLRCSAEIPLIAEVNGERKLVGSIRENTVIEVLARTKTEARVWVKSLAIHPAEDAELRARASDLSECKPVVTP